MGLARHGLWLYGILVGAAIKDAFESLLPRLLTTPFLGFWEAFPRGVRLVVFLVVVVRFYLGAAIFFSEVYERDDSDAEYPYKSFASDFLFGLFHFVLFFMWAFTLDYHARPLWLFHVILGLILLYDVMWFVVCRAYDSARRMKLWVALNLATFLLALLLYLLAQVCGAKPFTQEWLALLPVVLASAIDLVEMTSGRRIIGEFLEDLVR